MTKYKFTYFDLRGRGETTRMMFALAGVPYENVQLSFDNWTSIRHTVETPFGQLPMLDIDGQIICQSRVIESYVAKKHGLAGDTEMDLVRSQMIAGCLEDALDHILRARRETDRVKREQMLKAYEEERLPSYLKKLDDMIPVGFKFFLGNKLSWPDLAFAVFADFPGDYINIGVNLNDYPRLKAVMDGVYADPNIAKWVAIRPPSRF